MLKINKIRIALFIGFGLFIGISSCKKDYIDWAALQQGEIEAREHYLSANYTTLQVEDTVNGGTVTALLIDGDTISPTSTGLYYIETEEGTGISPTVGRLVTAKYIGKLLDGTPFDASDWFVHIHGSATSGWTEGVNMMKKGGKATIIVPSDLAYGQNEFTTQYITDTDTVDVHVPRYSTLIFEIELLNAQK